MPLRLTVQVSYTLVDLTSHAHRNSHANHLSAQGPFERSRAKVMPLLGVGAVRLLTHRQTSHSAAISHLEQITHLVTG